MQIVLQEDLQLEVSAQQPVEVQFRNRVVGCYQTDLLVENKVIVELKAVSKLMPDHKAQLINYLKATEIDLGLLMNFGDKPVWPQILTDYRQISFNQ